MGIALQSYLLQVFRPERTIGGVNPDFWIRVVGKEGGPLESWQRGLIAEDGEETEFVSIQAGDSAIRGGLIPRNVNWFGLNIPATTEVTLAFKRLEAHPRLHLNIKHALHEPPSE